jgi:predicted small integral membrane protein
MALRAARAALVGGIALFYTLVVFNNITDYDSNYQFVRHVLAMDTTFPGNHGMWRAITSPAIHTLFYLSIIAWEFVTMALCWWGTIRLVRALRTPPEVYAAARSVAIAALVSSLLMWLVAFLTVGGEWFLMWQSRTWNGQDAAFRMFAVAGIVLLVVLTPEDSSRSTDRPPPARR